MIHYFQTFPILSPEKSNCDTLFNVVLEVGDVDKVVNRVQVEGDELSGVKMHPQTVNSDSGSVRVGVVETGVGNIIHTIISTKNFNGKPNTESDVMLVCTCKIPNL